MNTRPPRERESKVQRSIVVRLERLGIRLFRRNVGAMRQGERFIRFSSPGQSDLWGFDRAGRHWEIEVKRPGNVPTPKQTEWLRECTRLGAVAFWADNTNTAERVADAVLAGGRIVWADGFRYNVEIP